MQWTAFFQLGGDGPTCRTRVDVCLCGRRHRQARRPPLYTISTLPDSLSRDLPTLHTSNGHFSINSHFISNQNHIADRIVTITEYKKYTGPVGRRGETDDAVHDEEEGDEALPTSPTTKTSRDARRAPLTHLPSFPSPSPASHDGREPPATPHRSPQTT